VRTAKQEARNVQTPAGSHKAQNDQVLTGHLRMMRRLAGSRNVQSAQVKPVKRITGSVQTPPGNLNLQKDQVLPGRLPMTKR